MKINIETIDHYAQRYNSIGDYWIDGAGIIQVRISEMKRRAYEWLVLIHELVEIAICHLMNVSFKSIDDFDKKFEEEREAGRHTEEEEPGDDNRAPYRIPHCFATVPERMLCAVLRCSWNDYEEDALRLQKLYSKREKILNRLPSVD